MLISKKRLKEIIHDRELVLVKRINDRDKTICNLKEQIQQLESFTTEELIEHSTNKILNKLKEIDYEGD